MSKLQKALSQLDAAARAHAENVLEATQLFAEGKIEQDALDQAITERDGSTKRREALLVAIQAEAAKNSAAEVAKEEDKRKTAGVKALALLADIEGAAADLDSIIGALVNTAARFEAATMQFRALSYQAGMRGDQRNFLTDLRPLSIRLASELLRSGLSGKLDQITVSAVYGHDKDASIVEMVEGRSEKLRNFIERL